MQIYNKNVIDLSLFSAEAPSYKIENTVAKYNNTKTKTEQN